MILAYSALKRLPIITTSFPPSPTSRTLVSLSSWMTRSATRARSTHLREKPSEFLTVDLFIDELENLIKHFGVQDGFHLLGHSWGGILASEFEVRRQPPGLRKLVLADSLAASSLWNQSNAQLVQSFPKEVQEGLMGGMKNPKAFQAALREFHAHHGCLVKPLPAEFLYSLDQVFGENGDMTVATAP